ncbi:hypothetical protein lbkm_0764 [Lachnospiraceae bacterium KM106-2]|nr:hypothetical protein lbkm_0764 [Lachnospiraceae bacterium KM106-2]
MKVKGVEFMAKKIITLMNIVHLVEKKWGTQKIVEDKEGTKYIVDKEACKATEEKPHCIIKEEELKDPYGENPYMYVAEAVKGKLVIDDQVVTEKELYGFIYQLD